MTLPSIAGVQSRILHLPDRPPFMTSHDMATFYQQTPANVVRQTRRNIGRFPEGYIFEPTEAELAVLVSQNGAPNRVNRGTLLCYSKKGCLQLSSVLGGPVADAVSVIVIDAFDRLDHRDIAMTRHEAAIDRQEYIGKLKLRQRIIAAAEAGASYTDLWARWGYSHRVLTAEIEAMRLRGHIDRMALIPPLYVLRQIEAKKEQTAVHVDDARQMRLGLEG